MNKITFPHQSGRLLSLDILRGITIAGMIMVNNPGSWNYIYTPLGHLIGTVLLQPILYFHFLCLLWVFIHVPKKI